MPEDSFVHNGFSASLYDFDKQTKLEKLEANRDENNLTCYVASCYDQRYSVEVKLNTLANDKRCFCAELYVDGQCVRATFLGMTDFSRKYNVATFDYVDGGNGAVYPLRFGKAITSGNLSLSFYIHEFNRIRKRDIGS